MNTRNTQYEYLGMNLDDRLSMNDYLNVIWKKVNTTIGILSRIRRFILDKTAVRIYKCMIRPHLDYIDFVIDSGSADKVQRLDNLNKKKQSVELSTAHYLQTEKTLVYYKNCIKLSP